MILMVSLSPYELIIGNVIAIVIGVSSPDNICVFLSFCILSKVFCILSNYTTVCIYHYYSVRKACTETPSAIMSAGLFLHFTQKQILVIVLNLLTTVR